MSTIRQLRIAGIAEGVSFIALLFIAMPLKYVAGYPLAVTIVGSIHGFLFITYLVAMFRALIEHKWGRKKIAEVFVASLYPFGTFILDRKLKLEDNVGAAP
jgi:integral membrane protein